MSDAKAVSVESVSGKSFRHALFEGIMRAAEAAGGRQLPVHPTFYEYEKDACYALNLKVMFLVRDRGLLL